MWNLIVSLGIHVPFSNTQQSTLNMAYCCLFLFGKIIQRLVFGNIRPNELQVRNGTFFVTIKFILGNKSETRRIWIILVFTLITGNRQNGVILCYFRIGNIIVRNHLKRFNFFRVSLRGSFRSIKNPCSFEKLTKR